MRPAQPRGRESTRPFHRAAERARRCLLGEWQSQQTPRHRHCLLRRFHWQSDSFHVERERCEHCAVDANIDPVVSDGEHVERIVRRQRLEARPPYQMRIHAHRLLAHKQPASPAAKIDALADNQLERLFQGQPDLAPAAWVAEPPACSRPSGRRPRRMPRRPCWSRTAPARSSCRCRSRRCTITPGCALALRSAAPILALEQAVSVEPGHRELGELPWMREVPPCRAASALRAAGRRAGPAALGHRPRQTCRSSSRPARRSCKSIAKSHKSRARWRCRGRRLCRSHRRRCAAAAAQGPACRSSATAATGC